MRLIKQSLERKEHLVTLSGSEHSWPFYGKPAIIFHDRGKIFTSERARQVLVDRLGIITEQAPPYAPSAKGTVETLFGWMTERFERRLPGTSYGVHDAETAAQAGGMTLEELERCFYQAIVDDYQQAFDGLQRQPRCVLWDQAVAQSGVPQYLGSPDDLKQLLMKTVNRKTPPHGYRTSSANRLSFQRRWYVCPGLLSRLAGREFDVYYDHRDVGVLYLFVEGEYVREAYCPQLMGGRVSEWEARAISDGRICRNILVSKILPGFPRQLIRRIIMQFPPVKCWDLQLETHIAFKTKRKEKEMLQSKLSDFVEATAKKFKIPGVAVGVWASGKEAYAYHGVTSVENPLPIDQDTLFLVASVTKTFTATTLIRLVAEGKVELNAPVRRYIPELQLKDKQAADKVTVLNLLNHTAGFDWRVNADTGEGDDALERYVAKMAELKQIAPLGTRVSYSQAGYNLLGRIIEKVTGQTFEQAVASLVFEPLGLSHSFFARDDIMTRRFAVGHNRGEDGTLSIARPWRHSRSDNPGGGVASSVADLLRWARFHLGDGSAASGARVLSTNVLHQMKDPTAELRASTLGDAIGLSWFLRDVDGVRTVGHGGSANGQFAELLIVPERNFAVISLSNAGPDGIPFNQAIVRWALEHYLGLIDRDPEPIPFDAVRTREIVGTYENEMMRLTIDTVGARLRLEVLIKPEIRAAANQELPQDYAPFDFGLLPGDKDEYIITNGALKGQRGFFTRDKSGAVVGVDLAGRLFSRVPIVSE